MPDDLAGPDDDDMARRILDGEVTEVSNGTVNADLGQRMMSVKKKVSDEEAEMARRILDGDYP